MAVADASVDALPVPRVTMRGISKAFPGVQALDSVDFELRAGEVHALLGENGAGKSTLIKVLTGVEQHDAGRMQLDDQPLEPRTPLAAQRQGISTVYQEVNLIPHLSVAENIFLGRAPRRWGCIRWRTMRRRAADLLAGLDLHIDVSRPLSDYSLAIQQMIAIARALDVEARVLILDEPTSSLDAREVERLFDVMRRLRSQGLGIIFITHFLEQAYEISDRITVLRNGRRVGTHAARDLPRLELIAQMIGRSIEEAAALRRHEPVRAAGTESRPLLRAHGFGRRGSIASLDLRIDTHEIVGLAGLLGSGRTETARLLFGLDRADCGALEINDRPVRMTSPRRAIAERVGFCPEDRKTAGIVPELSVRENIVLALQARRGWLRPLGLRRSRALADRFIRALRIATPDAEKPVEQLSGGNQQKVILARWLASEPRLLIVDEPTRGIDVGAKAEIERLLADLCRNGLAILLISSELDEVVHNAHRVVVLRDRHQVGELAGDAVSLPAIMELIAAEVPDA